MEEIDFLKLAPRLRALVAVAVLFDGREAAAFLENDLDDGRILKEATNVVAALPPDLRMPYLGTVLRVALKEMADSDHGRAR